MLHQEQITQAPADLEDLIYENQTSVPSER